MPALFITGTDTGVGKTRIACGLVQSLAQAGLHVAVMKPVAAGCHDTAQGLRNEDAELLMQAATVKLPYETVNPCALRLPASPHLAAAAEDKRIDIAALVSAVRATQQLAPWLVVEGAGGWLVPLNEQHTLADLAVALRLPVILVVGIRLGCLNHALLTVEAITRSGLTLAGWVANRIDSEMLCTEENIATLQQRIAAPLLGVVPYEAKHDAARVAASLDIAPLLNITAPD